MRGTTICVPPNPFQTFTQQKLLELILDTVHRHTYRVYIHKITMEVGRVYLRYDIYSLLQPAEAP